MAKILHFNADARRRLLVAQPGAIIAPGFGDLAEGLARPSSAV